MDANERPRSRTSPPALWNVRARRAEHVDQDPTRGRPSPFRPRSAASLLATSTAAAAFALPRPRRHLCHPQRPPSLSLGPAAILSLPLAVPASPSVPSGGPSDARRRLSLSLGSPSLSLAPGSLPCPPLSLAPAVALPGPRRRPNNPSVPSGGPSDAQRRLSLSLGHAACSRMQRVEAAKERRIPDIR